MTKNLTQLLLAVVISFGTILTSATANAQISCEDAKIVDRLPQLPNGCQKERIQASGNLSYGVLRSAQSLAEKAWKREVITKYGERFQKWDFAACAKQECVPGALAGSSRCTYSGFPCATRPYLVGVAELSKAEIEEVQRLLSRAGYAVKADGSWGEKSSSALIKWQKKNRLPEDGLPSRENLDKLRKKIA